MFWWAQDHDVLVLAATPNEAFGRYVCGLTGVDYSTLRFIVPGLQRERDFRLTRERLVHQETVSAIRAEFSDAPTEVFATWPSIHVAHLVRELGWETALAGYSFQAQGGARLVTSKCDFRAVAGGVGVTLPDGSVCRSRDEAQAETLRLFRAGADVILKAEFSFGGRGNEVLTQVEGYTTAAARDTVTILGEEDVLRYFDERWPKLSNDGQAGVSVEEFHRGCRSVFAEFEIAENGVWFLSDGEMLVDATPPGEVMPAIFLDPDVREELKFSGRALCEALRAIGYRGTLSADAVVTPDGDLLFTEWNGRRTDSTHIHACIGSRVLGDSYGTDRVLHDCVRWNVGSHDEAVALLDANGLLYDPTTKIGVIPCTAHNERLGRLAFCVVHVDEAQALALEMSVRALDVDSAPERTSKGGEQDGQVPQEHALEGDRGEFNVRV